MSTLRERFGNWIAGKGKTNGRATAVPVDITPSYVQNYGHGVATAQPNAALLLQESIGIADVATRAIANRIASLEIQVKQREHTADGGCIDSVLNDHPLKNLLDNPHPDLTKPQFMRLTTQYIVTTGESYWIKAGNGFGVPGQLHVIPPTMIAPQVRGNVVVAYTTRDANGKERMIPADAVVRFFLPDPENPWRGEGYLAPMGITADSYKFSGQHLRHHYQEDATPKTVLEAGEGAGEFDSDSREGFHAQWKDHYHQRYGTRSGLPAILPTHYKLIELAMQTGADLTPLLEHWRDDLLMGMGTPRSILGQVVSGDRSSAETNKFVFDLHTVFPITCMIEETLTKQLAVDFEGNVICKFAPFVQPDKEFELQKEAQDLANAIRTPNKILEDRGEVTVEWGDEPLLQTKLKKYDPDAPDPLALSDSGQNDEGEEEEVPASTA